MNIKVDSRKIKKGDTFVALRCKNDGHDYVQDAISNGANKVVVDHGLYNVETIIVKDTKEYLIKHLKDNYYNQIKDLKLIGITGTNGKTTTCFLIHDALNRLGLKCGYIGTIGFYINNKIRDLNNTTPDILDIYEMLIECKENGCEYVVMEVSSHALDMKRVEGLLYDYAIFTNLTKDHLDYHKTMDDYCKCKQKLFTKLKENGKAIINYDSDYKNYFLLDNNNITYGFSGGDYQIIDYNISQSESSFLLKSDDDIDKFSTKLIGKHNLYNILAAVVILKQVGIDNEVILNVVQDFQAPSGRMETIIYNDNTIIVDYAHTPDAVENILNAAVKLNPKNIYTIIGCGGDRDKTKRPEMSKVATLLSTHVILTSDNPRTEDPLTIINDMLQNLDNINYEIEVNREKAIIKGIQMLKKNDILLVLGKGHEKYQVIGTKKIDFDDKKIILDNI